VPSVLVPLVDTENTYEEFHVYVKPTVHPHLSPFCTELTGITQAQVNSGISLVAALDKHTVWLRKYVPEEQACIFVTCGDYDLKRSIPEDPNINESRLPECYRQWINIKKAFGAFYKIKQPRGMTEMLERLDLKLEGRHHSGIDDCRNIVK